MDEVNALKSDRGVIRGAEKQAYTRGTMRSRGPQLGSGGKPAEAYGGQNLPRPEQGNKRKRILHYGVV